jgi:translation initiation factor IF-2
MAICVICRRDCPPSLLSVAGVCPSCATAAPAQPTAPATAIPVRPSARTGVPQPQEVYIGRAVVRAVFTISRVGTVAGCEVTSGKIARSARIRVLREGIVVFPAGAGKTTLTALKRFKDDVQEVRHGLECGLSIEGFDDLMVGDIVEAYLSGQDQQGIKD